MLRSIDHLVIAVPDLDTAVGHYRALGFTVVPGGRHPVGTHNALIAFADESYLELIAFYQPNAEHRWWTPLQQGGGLVDYCLVTDELAGDTAAFRRAGVEIADPRGQSRVRPDGVELRWVFSLAQGAHRGVAPFLIRDETPREERVPREMTHPNGVAGIKALTVAVRDVETVRGWYAKVLGEPGAEVQRDDLGAAGVRFTIGPHAFDFVAPSGAVGQLAGVLKDRGPGPYAVTFRSPSAPPGALDPTHTLGARLLIER